MRVTPLAQGSLLRAAHAAATIDIDDLAAGGVLVLVPHPDDETLGCGAALAAAVEAGHAAHVVLLTDGGASHPESICWPRARLAARRAQELRDALEVLGDGRITHERLGFPDQHSPEPASPEGLGAIDRLLDTLRKRRPAHLWTVWEGDPHIDHERCAALARALLDAAADEGLHPVLSSFPVWGRFVETGAPHGNACPEPEHGVLSRFVPSRAGYGRKARALACHATQMTHAIDDDPTGFVMPMAMQAHFLEHDELFLRRRPFRRDTGAR